jgi:hypothetical protein
MFIPSAAYHPVCVITSGTDVVGRILDLLSFNPAVNPASRTFHYLNFPNEATVIMPLGVHPPIARHKPYGTLQARF